MDDLKISYRNTPLKDGFIYQTVKERLETLAGLSPEKEACVVYDLGGSRTSITRLELLCQSRLFAKGLQNLGVTKGDIVAVSLPNGPEWMVCTFGIQLIGAIPLLFMFNRQDGTDILNVLVKSKDCKAILFDPGQDDINWGISTHFIQSVGEGGKVKSDQVPSLQYMILSRGIQQEKNVLVIKDVLKRGETVAVETKIPDLDPDDVAAILLSSGSKGTQKLIVYTHLHLLETGHTFVHAYELKEKDVYFNANSFNWGAAYPFIYLYTGATRVSCSNVLQLKGKEKIIDIVTKAISNERCTIAMTGVPIVLEMIKNESRNNDWAKSLKTIACAGLPISSRCSKILEKFGEYFVIVYGSTEVGAISFLRKRSCDLHVDYNVGVPMPGFEMKIVDDLGNTVPVNTVGELYVRHCIRHLGYHNDMEKTDDVFTQTGWYKTDDMGKMMEDGTFIVCGRKSEMLVVGGNLVSPMYLESVILSHPKIQEVAVVPIADDEMFYQPCACIIEKEPGTLSENELKEYFEKEFTLITEYSPFLPKYYLFFEEFPKTPLNKLSRVTLTKIANERVQSL